jgi:hypothetical protein
VCRCFISIFLRVMSADERLVLFCVAVTCT